MMVSIGFSYIVFKSLPGVFRIIQFLLYFLIHCLKIILWHLHIFVFNGTGLGFNHLLQFVSQHVVFFILLINMGCLWSHLLDFKLQSCHFLIFYWAHHPALIWLRCWCLPLFEHRNDRLELIFLVDLMLELTHNFTYFTALRSFNTMSDIILNSTIISLIVVSTAIELINCILLVLKLIFELIHFVY